MRRSPLVIADLRGVSDDALITAFDRILRERRLPPMVIGDGWKAADGEADDDSPEDFAEQYLAEAVAAFHLDFSSWLDRVMAMIHDIVARGRVAMPLNLERGDDVTIRQMIDEQAGTFLERIGFGPSAIRRVRARAPWLPDIIEQGYRMGAVSATIPEATPWQTAWTVAQRRPLTEVDRRAIAYAKARAGAYLRPIPGRVGDDAMRRLLSVHQDITRRRTAVGARAHIHPSRLAGFMADLTGWREDRGDGRMIWTGGSWARDWLRVARTEMADASAHGHLMAHLQDHPINADAAPGSALQVPRQLCFKIPQKVRRNNTGGLVAPCKHCHRIWYWDDETPRLYPLDEVVGNGSNAGPPPLKAAAWRATVGPTHPNDLCGRINIYVPGSEALFPGFRAQLARYAGQGYEGVE